MGQGPVTVGFFAGDDVGGPARILLPDGRTLWAFTSRLGARPPVDDRPTSVRRATGTTNDASSAAIVPAAVIGGHGLHDGDPDRDGFGDGTGESSWAGSDGGGGWSGGGWSGGDSGGGGDLGGGDS